MRVVGIISAKPVGGGTTEIQWYKGDDPLQVIESVCQLMTDADDRYYSVHSIRIEL